jgi:hypothetical protein
MIGVIDLGKVLDVRSFSDFFPPDSRAMSGVGTSWREAGGPPESPEILEPLHLHLL